MLKKFLFFLFVFVLLACDSGSDSDDSGDGSDFAGAGTVNLKVSPTSIDTGDRVEVRITINSIHEDGIALKVNFPEELQYVKGSSFSFSANEEDAKDEIKPQVFVTENDGTYLVFFVDEDDFKDDENGDGAVVFQLEAFEETQKGAEISIDADVDDPSIENISEFSLDEPQFEAEESKTVLITG